MTRLLLDIASYQGDLALADVQRAGFSAINLKISHGLGLTSVHPNVAGYAADAKTLGLGICTFHYLTGGATGAAQATYAYKRLLELGLVDGTAHQVDVESTSSPPTWQIIADYVNTMRALLGRPIALYTGDWWWTAAGRGWNGAELTPYLWAAASDNPYPGTYPGDDSPDWRVGYGGWPALAVMQYAVEPLRYPDGTTGTIKVSKSAVRDPAVWAALTGGDGMVDWVLTAGLQNLRSQVNARWSKRDKTSDGTIGDAAHTTHLSGHNPDDSPYDNAEWDSDPDTTPEVRAWDMDTDLGEPGANAQMVVDHIRRLPDVGTVLRYMIYNGKMYHVRDGFAPTAYTGPSPHTEHVHFSGAWSQASDNNTSFDYRLDDVNMPTVDEIVTGLLSAPLGSSGPTVGVALQNGISDATVSKLLSKPLGSSGPNVAVALQTGAYQNSVSLLAKASDLLAKATDLLAGQAAESAAIAQLAAAIADLRALLAPPVNG
jgi:hypothetical protein